MQISQEQHEAFMIFQGMVDQMDCEHCASRETCLSEDGPQYGSCAQSLYDMLLSEMM